MSPGDSGAAQASPGAAAGGLRGHVLIQSADQAAGGLAAFLQQTDPRQAAILWFGADGLPKGARLVQALARDIAEIDDLLSRIVNAVVHHPRFQALESVWRGVGWLVDTAAADSKAVVRLLNVSWAEVGHDLERAAEFDQSEIFEKIYHQEFGMPGGLPFGLLVGDYQMRHKPRPGQRYDDISILRLMSAVAAAAFCPFVCGADPVMFDADSFADLDLRQDIAVTFQQPAYARLRSLRQSRDTRFLGVIAPRVMLRPPPRGRELGDLGFMFDEAEADGFLWGNGAFAFAQVVLRAFIDFRWMAGVRGTPIDEVAGGAIDLLPLADFATDAPGVALRGMGEVAMSPQQEAQLNELGFASFRPCYQTPYWAFYSAPSLHKPPKFDTPAANLNARLGGMLHYILCVSRFAHYIKVIARDWVGSYKTAEECQNLLQGWIQTYCTIDESASFETKARFPLRQAQVMVREIPGAPGTFSCSVDIQPHFQIDQVFTEFQIVTELEKAA